VFVEGSGLICAAKSVGEDSSRGRGAAWLLAIAAGLAGLRRRRRFLQ
jgi:MYXO-CTERM domain-containing protein